MAIPGNTEGVYEGTGDDSSLAKEAEQVSQGVVQDAQKLEQETITSGLGQILNELKMIRLHWQKASGNKFTEEDIEE